MSATAPAAGRPWAGYLLGFALGGFFDGILLHQILQWHHLLLGIESGPFRDIRVQILADGLFHLLMYGVALAGLGSLWRSRCSAVAMPGKALLGDAFIGFGAWHAIDAVLSHWILGIHRIKMDSQNLLFWDLLWFFAFGVAPVLLGLVLRRGTTGGSGGARPVAAGLALAALTAAPLAAVPPRNADYVAVMVRPGEAGRLLDGLRAANGAIMWADRSGALWVFRLGDRARTGALYEHGALLVTRSPAALGCLAWTRPG